MGGSDGKCDCDEIVHVCACDWKEHGGWFFECWKIEPCCGKPANLGDALMCVICFTCCSPCSCTKLYATSLSQDCALVNHCLPMFCFPPCVMCFMRHNYRIKDGIGPTDPIGWLGDCLFGWIFPFFMGCQILRGSDDKAYDWIGQMGETGVLCCVDPWKLVVDLECEMRMPAKTLTGVVKDAGDLSNEAARKLGSQK